MRRALLLLCMLSAPRPPPALLARVHPRFLLLHPGMFVVQVAVRPDLLPSPCLAAPLPAAPQALA